VSWAEHVASGKRTEVNGLEIFYIDRGSGDVVVLIHGWAPSSFIWRRIVPHLSHSASGSSHQTSPAMASLRGYLADLSSSTSER